jgi:hypothetical protein
VARIAANATTLWKHFVTVLENFSPGANPPVENLLSAFKKVDRLSLPAFRHLERNTLNL